MIPSQFNPKALYSELVEWHQQIKSLRKCAPDEASAGIDAQSRQVCVVMPQDSTSVKSTAQYDWSLLSKTLNDMATESLHIARQLGLREPAPIHLKPHEFAACSLELLDELISGTVNTDSGQLVLLREAMNQQLTIMLQSKRASWNDVDVCQQRMMSDLQKTIGALQWHYHSELQHISPRLETFLIEWMSNAVETIQASRWPDADKTQLIKSLHDHIGTTLESVRENMLPLETLADEEPAQLSFRQQTSYSSRSSPPFYMEPQEKQACGRHAGNAFLGGPLIKSSASNEQMNTEAVFEAMADCLQKPENKKLFDQPMKLCSYHALASDDLFREMDNLKHDRVLILAELNSHYLTFRRDQDGNWYKLESAVYEQHEQEPIKPGNLFSACQKTHKNELLKSVQH